MHGDAFTARARNERLAGTAAAWQVCRTHAGVDGSDLLGKAPLDLESSLAGPFYSAALYHNQHFTITCNIAWDGRESYLPAQVVIGI